MKGKYFEAQLAAALFLVIPVASLATSQAVNDMLDVAVVLDLEPSSCTMTITNASVDLGQIAFNSLPATGSALLDRGDGFSWNSATGPSVEVDCNDNPVKLAFVLQDNQQESLDTTTDNSRLGLGRFNDESANSIGYYQLIPQNVLLDGNSTTDDETRISSNEGSTWQSGQGTLWTNRNAHINSWQEIIDSSGVDRVVFGLAGKVFLNGQDSVESSGASNTHTLQGSATLTVVVF